MPPRHYPTIVSSVTDDQAAVLLGLQFRAVPVSAKDGYSMRGEALRQVIEKDVATGLVPFFVGGFTPCFQMKSKTIVSIHLRAASSLGSATAGRLETGSGADGQWRLSGLPRLAL